MAPRARWLASRGSQQRALLPWVSVGRTHTTFERAAARTVRVIESACEVVGQQAMEVLQLGSCWDGAHPLALSCRPAGCGGRLVSRRPRRCSCVFGVASRAEWSGGGNGQGVVDGRDGLARPSTSCGVSHPTVYIHSVPGACRLLVLTSPRARIFNRP